MRGDNGRLTYVNARLNKNWAVTEVKRRARCKQRRSCGRQRLAKLTDLVLTAGRRYDRRVRNTFAVGGLANACAKSNA